MMPLNYQFAKLIEELLKKGPGWQIVWRKKQYAIVKKPRKGDKVVLLLTNLQEINNVDTTETDTGAGETS